MNKVVPAPVDAGSGPETSELARSDEEEDEADDDVESQKKVGKNRRKRKRKSKDKDNEQNSQEEDDSESDEDSISNHVNRQGVYKKKVSTTESHSKTKEKEVQILVGSIQDKMMDIFDAERWERRKTAMIVIAIVCTCFATFLILYGFSLTILFADNGVKTYVVVFGFLCYLPMVGTCVYFVLPGKEEKEKRKRLRMLAKERQDSNFLNKMMIEAARRAKPPELRVRLIAVIRGSRGFPRKEMVISATTVRAMLEEIEKATGLPQIQQLLKLEDGTVLTDNLESHFVNDLRLRADTHVYVYNKGRYEMSIVERCNPTEAAKYALAPPPPTWEENMVKQIAKVDDIDARISKSQKRSFLDLDEDDANFVNHKADDKLNMKNHKFQNKVNKTLATSDAASVGGSLVANKGSVVAGGGGSVVTAGGGTVAGSKVSFSISEGNRKVSTASGENKRVAWK